MFPLFELHRKFVVDFYFDIVNEDENEGEDNDSSGDEGRVPGDVGEGENELFPFTDDEDDDLEPNINGEDVVNGNEYEDYTSKATNDYSIDDYEQDLDNDDGLSDYNSDSDHDKVVSSEDEEEVDYMRSLSKRLYKDCPLGKVDLKDGQVFNDIKHFWNTLQDYVIQEGFEIHRKKNERTRVTTACKVVGCPWRIHASPTPTMSSITYMIKSYNNEHICTRVKKNYNATST
ncbi:hypothetical protein ACFX13_008981 [Malus domestica]